MNKSTYVILGLKMNYKPRGPSSIPTSNRTVNILKLCSLKCPRRRPLLQYLAVTGHVRTFPEFKESEISWCPRSVQYRVNTFEFSSPQNCLCINSESRENYIQFRVYNQISPWSCVFIFHATIPGISSLLTKSQ